MQRILTFFSSFFSIFTWFSICILHIALKDSYFDYALIGSSSVDILLTRMSLLKSKIYPLRIDSAILFPFTNSLWILKIRWYFTLVNISVCRSVPVTFRKILSSCLLFLLLLLLKFLCPLFPLPLKNIPPPTPHLPLPYIFSFYIFPDPFWSILSEYILSWLFFFLFFFSYITSF